MKNAQPVKSSLRIVFAMFFLAAGAYHFINPALYLPLIPDYLPNAAALNFISGALELVLGLLLLFRATKFVAAWGIVVLMLLFVPAHVHFIQVGGCLGESLCFPLWVAWLRLLLVHPLLIGTAYWFTKP